MTYCDVADFLLTDQVGTLRAVADTSGAIVKRIDYDSFGNIINDTNPGFSVPFGFAGGLHDRDTGLVRFGARDYSPELGRFTAKDPIDFAGGDTNLYAYVFNDPVNDVDPDGLINPRLLQLLQGAWYRAAPYVERAGSAIAAYGQRLAWRWSTLQRASNAANAAARRADGFQLGRKHMADACGQWNKFMEGVNPNAMLKEALVSPNARFFPNDAGSFKMVTDLGRQVGSKANQTAIRAIVDYEGNVITWFPVNP